MNAFEKYHPIVLLIYFSSVITLTMLIKNPIILLISLINSIIFSYITNEKTYFKKSLIYTSILFLLIAFTNPLFIHDGLTVLFFINDTPITLEAFYYGIYIGIMISATIFWFQSLNKILSSEKIIYLFSKFSPSFALMLSMTLRLIPKAKSQLNQIKNTNKILGNSKIKTSIQTISILITWLLENGVDTADSMRARGYGLKGKTNYSPYKFNKNDIIMTCFLLTLIIFIIVLIIFGANDFHYYPTVSKNIISSKNVLSFIAFSLISSIPIFIRLKEVSQWRLYQSKI